MTGMLLVGTLFTLGEVVGDWTLPWYLAPLRNFTGNAAESLGPWDSGGLSAHQPGRSFEWPAMMESVD